VVVGSLQTNRTISKRDFTISSYITTEAETPALVICSRGPGIKVAAQLKKLHASKQETNRKLQSEAS
jgi:hypothetical protein